MGKATTPSPVLIVRESFVIEVDGQPVAYRAGEPVDPADPVIKRLPESQFEPLAFPHPVKRGRFISPEIRA